PSDATLSRTPHVGGAPMVLDLAPGSGVVTDGSEVWYGVSSGSGGTIRNLSRDGGSTKDLFAPVKGLSGFDSIKVGARYVYFEVSSHMFHGFYRVLRTGGMPEPLLFDGVVAGFDAEAQQLFRARPFVSDGGN